MKIYDKCEINYVEKREVRVFTQKYIRNSYIYYTYYGIKTKIILWKIK